ncbi:AraC family transcriptional regulator [Actinoplanes teichomyceticus]|uniref:AraC family transcriptional regulator n=1 Tax=Actinoplanes teichomyceticus TaxID=1867 RepID=A0A561WBQ6_ACTTI|nr:AraC family transcriptional regulator [Actinoplanes teichomyceticus]
MEQVRVRAAQTLLENTDDTTDTVARRCGFGTAETMRRAFQRVLGIPPASYRERFHAAHPWG